MLKRRDRIERLDHDIADAEVRITEQVLRILAAEGIGEDTATARQALATFEGVLVEYRRARELLVEARRLRGVEPD